MPYRTSPPLARWRHPRRDAIDALRAAHGAAGRAGRRPVAQAYVLRLVAEFQGFTRELHDYGADRLARMTGAVPPVTAALIRAATSGRALDRGNADLRCLDADFRRLGIDRLGVRLGAANPRWSAGRGHPGDRAELARLIALRNSLAHGNDRQLTDLRRDGLLDTLAWAHARLPALNRIARALDFVVWTHLHDIYGEEPW
jgi:hypothetical protein